MKTLNVGRNAFYILALVALLVATLASAAKRSQAHNATINITVTNNSSGDIKHVFLSPPDSNLWSSDQLNDSAIPPGHSTSLNNVACDQASIRTIAEDQDGCFIYQSVSCSSDASVTITNDSTRDCGGS